MRRFAVPVMLFVLAVATLVPAVFIQHRKLEQVKQNPPFIEKWNLVGRSGELLGYLALRYDLVMADFLWLRAIQSFGGRGMTNRDWRPLYNLFDAITDLDPQFEEAYTFGNLVIGDEGGQQREALKLIDKGTEKIIDRYRVPFEGMYVAHWQMDDPALARWYGRVAMKRRDAPDWVPRIVAYVEVKSGQFYVGLDRFIGNLMQALDAEDPVLQDIAVNKIVETIDKWNNTYLVRAYDEYTTGGARVPRTIQDLANEPALQNYDIARASRLTAALVRVADKLGKPLPRPEILEDLARPTEAQLREVDLDTTPTDTQKGWAAFQNVIMSYAVTRMNGIPEDPSGKGYVLNLSWVGNPLLTDPEELFSTPPKLEEFLFELLMSVRSRIQARTQELNHTPTSLTEVFYTDFLTTEPLGGQFHYNSSTGEFRSSSRPQM